MTQLNKITLDNVEYVRADSIDYKPTKKQIVVLQRGWIVIGDVEKSEAEVNITNCSVIRVWGTSKGLGEIAFSGPTGKTILDECPDISVHPLTVVLYMNVNEDKWND